MTLIRNVGVTPDELDALVDQDRWDRWRRAEPALRGIDSLRAMRPLRGEEEDSLLGALIRLGAKDAGNDQLAAIAVMHQLGGSIRVIACRHRHLCSEDIDGIVVGAMWEQIRSFDWRTHTRHYGAALTHGTRRAVQKLLIPDRHSAAPLDPHSWLFEAAAGVEDPESTIDQLDSRDELDAFFAWAVAHRRISPDEISLLVTLLASDRANPEIPKWRRGACSVAALAEIADRRGVCTKSIVRARDRALKRLRQAVPAYLDEVA